MLYITVEKFGVSTILFKYIITRIQQGLIQLIKR